MLKAPLFSHSEGKPLKVSGVECNSKWKKFHWISKWNLEIIFEVIFDKNSHDFFLPHHHIEVFIYGTSYNLTLSAVHSR